MDEMKVLGGYRCLRGASRTLTSLALITAATATACTSDVEFGDEHYGEVSQAVTSTSTVVVNQLGYLTGAKKVAVGIGACGGAAWTLKNSSGTTVASGTASAAVVDPGSGDTVCKADFSTYTTAGTGYTITIGSLGTSDPFAIGTTDRYGNLYVDAMKYFQFHRTGTEVVNLSLTGAKGGTVSRSWALRPTTALTAYSGWTAGTFNIDGGHADAGDFGLYADNAAQSMWVLMNLQELKNPDAAVYDLKGEIDYGVKFMMGLLPADATKQAAHKCHDDAWGTQNWGGYPAGNDVSASVRHCMGQSITATYSVARGLGQAARIVSNATTATSYWNKAVEAWNRANGATTPVYAGPSPGAAVGGGDYQDNTASDDKFDAAVEMYLTAKKRGVSYTSYLSAVTSSSHYKQISRMFDWGEGGEATQGNLSLYAYHKANANALTGEIDITGIENAILAEADAILGTIAANGYPVPISGGSSNWVWGSNKIVMNSAILLAYAREISGNVNYTKGIHEAMDYVMGVNTLRLGMITGYGTYTERATHDRMANGNSPIGWLSGGPLAASMVNDPVTPKLATPAKNYYVSDTGWDQAWCSRENTIDWNAPLAWVSWYIRSSVADLAGGGSCTPSCGTSNCGNKADGCGGTINCGTCSAGQTCSSNTCTAITPPPGSGWTFCANENGTCSFSGTQEVAYGANSSWNYGNYTTSTPCNNATFGDPISGVGKSCWYRATGGTQAPYGGTARSATSTVQAEDYDTGGQGVAFNDADTANNGGQYRTDAVDIQATTDTDGGYNVGWTGAGEWLEYTVSVATTGTYSLDVRVASPAAQTFHVEVDGVNVTGTLNVNTGAWQTWSTVSKTGISLTAGTRVVRVVFDSGSTNFNWFKFNAGTSSCTPADCNDNNPCTVDTCNSGTCSNVAGNSGAVCRAAAGDCDQAETCSGTSTTCPSDAKKSSGTVCRAASGQCDVAETCSGSSNSCPSNAYAASGTACTGGTCDGANQCVASGGGEPCTPQRTLTTETNSGNFNTSGAFCFRTSYNIAGWGCSNFDGRSLQVNDTTKSCGSMPLPTKYNGYYYFEATAGTLDYASVYWW